MPARLSSPNVPMCSMTNARSASHDLAVEQADLRVREARLGPAAEVHDDLDECGAIGQRVNRGDDLGRQRRQQRVEIVH